MLGEPYVEYADVQRVRVGNMVDVCFDPGKRDGVLLWDLGSTDAPFDGRSEAQFMAAAELVRAKILSVSQIPQISVNIPGLPPSLWLSLHVEAPAGAYDAGTCVQSVGIRALQAGETIGVWVEPNNHERLSLDISDLVVATS